MPAIIAAVKEKELKNRLLMVRYLKEKRKLIKLAFFSWRATG